MSAEPDVSPNGRWVVYSLYRNAQEDQSVLKKIRIDGTHRRTLDQTCTDPCLTDGYPAWGPGGKRVAFPARPRPEDGAQHDVCVVRDERRRLARAADHPTWKGHPLVRQPIGDFAPAWSPNGRRLDFERFSQTRGHQAVFTVRLDGTGLRRITPWWQDASQPDYSPNGRWILFRTRESSDVSGNIQLVRPNGADRHPVTHARSGHGKWLSASFSPNGRWITAGHTRVVDGVQLNADVFTFRLDGSGRRNVTATPGKWESAVDWGPTRR